MDIKQEKHMLNLINIEHGKAASLRRRRQRRRAALATEEEQERCQLHQLGHHLGAPGEGGREVRGSTEG